MSRLDPLADRETIVSFGKNVACCCEIIGSSLESLGLRADVDHRLFHDYIEGIRPLSKEVIESVCAELRLKELQLVSHYGSAEHRKKTLEGLLRNAGFIIASNALGNPPKAGALDAKTGRPDWRHAPIVLPKPATPVPAPIVSVPVAAPPPAVEPGKIPTPAAPIKIPAEPASLPPCITWDQNELLITLPSGKEVNLQDKLLRARIIATIRNSIRGTELSFARINADADLKVASSWWRGVEKGTCRVYGPQLVGIAACIGISAEELLHRAMASGPNVPENEIETSIPAEAIVADALPPALEREAEREQPMKEEAVQEPEPVAAVISAPVVISDAQFFRQLIFSKDTAPGKGVKIGELLELANGEEVDWVRSFLELTKAGQRVRDTIILMKEVITLHGEPVESLFRCALIEMHS